MPFTAKELLAMLCGLGHKLTLSELKDFLDNDARVFALQRNMYITRTGAFTNQLFSFIPTQREVEQKVFVPGDRCIPFVDLDMLSFSLTFEFLGQELPKKEFATDCNTARDMFCLYGDEFSAQYISSDPACQNLHIAENNFELPLKMNLTGISMEPIFEKVDFKYGDRILCRVYDWDKGIIELIPILTHKLNPFQISREDMERQKWYETLENALLESFDSMGPCSGIEEQLANVFYEHRKDLCIPDCGSIHEFLDLSKKIGLELFGVETRLWFKGKDVPAVGKWNEGMYVDDGRAIPFFMLPDFVIDCYIKDQMYEKKDDINEIIEKAIPKDIPISKDEKKLLTLQIENRNAILRKNYNWFADFPNGSLRHRALKLFTEVGSLVCELDCDNKELDQLPQQELVTLSQLYTHVSRILEILSDDSECAEDETCAMELSLEGMEMNFEDIKPLLISALDKVKKNRFNVI
ncbi:MAG: hypothetical protein IJJ71_05970 [Treponema sp.]|uniref:hypothetical protein n=1 Tax=Treponema sp. TaxID=166 RepID=UPI0025D5B942|nr:hypothetical protein [Treponema sp.]MBR0495700.1 hypothetical protein [Treponema sp.]